ncbi:MAG: chemotaxis protein CheW [Longimicrobiales bacterium]
MLFLVFEIGGQRYAIDTSQVVEVLPLVEWRSMPGVTPSVRGVFSFHGALVPLLDMTMLAFGMPAEMHRDTRIALVAYPTKSNDSRVLGILLEKATGLLRRNDEDFTDSPVESAAVYAGRVATDERGIIQRIEIRDLVPDDVWSALDGVTADAADMTGATS